MAAVLGKFRVCLLPCEVSIKNRLFTLTNVNENDTTSSDATEYWEKLFQLLYQEASNELTYILYTFDNQTKNA